MTLQAEFIAAQEQNAVKRTALKSLFDKANETSNPVAREELAGSIKTANIELADLVDKIVPLQEMLTAERENTAALKAMRQPVGRQIDPTADNVQAGDSPADDLLAAGTKSAGALLKAGLTERGLK